MTTLKQKLSSRKLWMAIAGVIGGLAIAFFKVDPNSIETISGAIMAIVSAASYIIAEGRVDAERIKNAVDKGEDAIEEFKKPE